MLLNKMNKNIALLLPAFVLLLISGCDNTIEPFEEDETNYSMYGYFKMSEDEHYIRVKDVNRPLLADSTRDIDVEVTFKNLTRDEETVLEGERVELEDLYVHNFPVEVDVNPLDEYELVAERSSGETSKASVDVPEWTDAIVTPEDQSCTTEVEVKFPEAAKRQRIEARAGFEMNNQTYWITQFANYDEDDNVTVTFVPQEMINVMFIEDYQPGDDLFSAPPYECSDMDADYFLVEYFHYGSDWDDYGHPIDPLESFDVENGLGFIGGFHKEEITFPVDTTTVF